MSWDDKDDEHTQAISDAHPLRTNGVAAHRRYDRAREMVGNRHSKYALVDLVNWLLLRAETAECAAKNRGAK